MTAFYRSMIGAGLLFGLLGGVISCLALSSGLAPKFVDPIIASALFGCIVATIRLVDLKENQDSFYTLFFSACITFLVFASTLALYFKICENNVEADWLKLLLIGIGICYVFALGAKSIRQKKKS